MYKHTPTAETATNQRLALLGYLERLDGRWVLTRKGRLATENRKPLRSQSKQNLQDQHDLLSIIRDQAK